MIDLHKVENIYLVPGFTDMRKQVDGLLSVISVNHQHLVLKPNNIFFFCGKSKIIIKILEIDDTGVWVYYKRTHGDKFIWPKSDACQMIDKRQLLWLLDGLHIIQKNAHQKQSFSY